MGPCDVILSDYDVGTDLSVFWSIFIEGIYETDYKGAVVLDIGAHKGYYAAYALLQGAVAVRSFEPETKNFNYLAVSSRSLRCKGVEWIVEKAAVGASDGTAVIYVAEQSWAHSMFKHPELGGESRREIVQLISFESVLRATVASRACQRVIVKIDAEGAACDIVLRTTPHEWRKVHELMLEIEPFSPCSEAEVTMHLRSAGLLLVGKRADVLHFRNVAMWSQAKGGR